MPARRTSGEVLESRLRSGGAAALKGARLGLLFLWMQAAAAAEPPRVVADVGFATPESAEYDAHEDVYIVTNINGSPLQADGNGFISKLAPDGRVIDLKWIDGAEKGVVLNAPKGAAVQGRRLFVADLGQVHVFALPHGQQLGSVTIAGATFLNGVTPAGDDSVYVTDSGYRAGFSPSGTDAVHRVWADGSYETVLKDRAMGHPNGVLADGPRLVVATFGSGQLFSVDAAGRRTPLPAPPAGRLDGLIRLEDGRLVFSSWDGAAVYALNADRTFSVLAEGLDAPADLGYDAKRNRVLVPLFRRNQLVILPLSESVPGEGADGHRRQKD